MVFMMFDDVTNKHKPTSNVGPHQSRVMIRENLPDSW